MSNYNKEINFNLRKNNFTKNEYMKLDSKDNIDISKYKKTRMHVKKKIPLNL